MGLTRKLPSKLVTGLSKYYPCQHDIVCKLIGVTVLSQVWGWEVFIFDWVYLCTVYSLFFFFLLWLHAPFLWWLFPYIVAHFLHLSLPPIDFLRNPLNACSIRTSWKLCEEIWVGMTLFRCRFSINAANSFWCSAFNVVVIVSFLDISFLVVGPTLLLSLKLIFLKWLTP